MFNTFEQGHNEWLEPKYEEQEIIARDWEGTPICEGDGQYIDTPEGLVKAEPDFIHEWIIQNYTFKEF